MAPGPNEKIDLLAPHGLSGTASRSKRGVPVLQPAHGKLAVGNALGLELAVFNRSRMTIIDFADPRLSAEIHVAEFLDHLEVGADVRQSVEWTASVLRDPLSRERAKSTFDTFVDPAEIDRVFDLWRDVLLD